MGQEQPFTLNSRGVVVIVVVVVDFVVVVIVVVVVVVVLGQLTQRHGWVASRTQGRLARPLNQPAKFKGNYNCLFLPSWVPFLSKPKQSLVVFYWTYSIL